MPETRQQILRRAAELPVDSSRVIHRLPDGYSIRRLKSRGDAHREGKLMQHCWRLDSACAQLSAAEAASYLAAPSGHALYHSLRDPANLPCVSFLLERDEEAEDRLRLYMTWPPEDALLVLEPVGPRNRPPTSADADRLRQWAQTLRRPVFVEWYDAEDDLTEIDFLNDQAERLFEDDCARQPACVS